MDISTIQAACEVEKRTDTLQPLDDSFYIAVGEYVQELCGHRDRLSEELDNPFDSEEIKQLSDSIASVEMLVEQLYEMRVGKIVKAASCGAAGFSYDVDGLTPREEVLFESALEDLNDCRDEVMGVTDDESMSHGCSGEKRTNFYEDKNSPVGVGGEGVETGDEVEAEDRMEAGELW